MLKKIPIHPRDIQGVSRLTKDAISGVVDLVEALHYNITEFNFSPTVVPAETSLGKFQRLVPSLVYQTIRSVNTLVGGGIDAVLDQLIPIIENGNGHLSPVRETILSALNGIVGDYLAETTNPLAIRMGLRNSGKPLVAKARDMAAALPELNGKMLLMVHGLCMNDLQWRRRNHDHGAALAEALDYTPTYLHYNTGVHISQNGRALTDLLERVTNQWPVPLEEIVIVAHSMGGLVCRSACHYGAQKGHQWLEKLSKIVFLGTPHHGAWLEQGGNWIHHVLGITPYAAPFSRLGNIRNAGITDLRYGNLVDEDWSGQNRFDMTGDIRKAVPLPQNAECFVIAAANCAEPGFSCGWRVGDGLVSVNSALGKHEKEDFSLPLPESQKWIGYGMHHMDLLSHPDVYRKLHQWLS